MTSRPWLAENEISAGLAARLITDQMPELAPARLESYGAGWDNTAFLVNDTWVFRFPRRQIAVGLIETEMRLLPAIADSLPMPIPQPVWKGEPTDDFPWPFAGYRYLQGTTACRADLNDEARCRLAEPMARFLKALHSLEADVARAAGAGPDIHERLDVPKRTAQVRERLEKLAADGHLPGGDPSPWLAVAEAAPTSWTPGSTTLVHGDLYARHLLVDENNALCGVIDWGDVHLGDAAIDLRTVLTMLPPPGRQRFFEIYGDVDPARLAVARQQAVFSAVALLIYGHDVGDDALVREGEVGLRLNRPE